MNKSIWTTLKTILGSLVSVLALFGIGEWLPLVDFLLQNFDAIQGEIETITKAAIRLFEFALAFWALRPSMIKHTTGQIVAAKFKESKLIKSTSSRENEQAIYNFTDSLEIQKSV